MDKLFKVLQVSFSEDVYHIHFYANELYDGKDVWSVNFALFSVVDSRNNKIYFKATEAKTAADCIRIVAKQVGYHDQLHKRDDFNMMSLIDREIKLETDKDVHQRIRSESMYC